MTHLSEDTAGDRANVPASGFIVNIPLALADLFVNSWINQPPTGGRPLFWASAKPAEREALAQQCIAWLRQRDPKGALLRKIAEYEARQHFGKPLTAHVFRTAYKRTYNRKRGRRAQLK